MERIDNSPPDDGLDPIDDGAETSAVGVGVEFDKQLIAEQDRFFEVFIKWYHEQARRAPSHIGNQGC